MIKLVFVKDTIAAQVEGCFLIGMRFGNKILTGIAFKLWKIKNTVLRKIIYKIFPVFYFSLLRHTGQSDRREIFCLRLLGTQFSFVTKGERKKCQISFLWWTYNKYGY